MEPEHRLTKERLEKLEALRKEGINPYPYSYTVTHHATQIVEKYKILKAEEKTKDKVSVAGRIMQMRRMGKATFLHILDETAKLQIFFREDDMGKKEYGLLHHLDIGDIIGIEGCVFATKTGEITVSAQKLTVLSKSILPMPDKYHGLVDIELRYRMRYVDLFANPETRERFRTRAKILREIRTYLDEKEFLEVETPVLQPIYGGANARPFKTHHNALNIPLYLKISPELYLKRLIVGGFEKVYDMNKNFRNEGCDHEHNPEFTMIEWYEAYGDYVRGMEMTENLIKKIARDVVKKTTIEYKGHTVDLIKPFCRLSMKDALKQYAKIDVDKYDEADIGQLVKTYNLVLKGDLSKGAIIAALFEELVEDKLIQPTFIIDYPKEVCPLTKIHRLDPLLTERFELYVCGHEWANGYSELTDPLDQRQRLEVQEKNRVVDDEAHPMDEDFVRAIEFGMPPTSGVGLGVDRMVMFFTNAESIRDVILFPTMKPEQK